MDNPSDKKDSALDAFLNARRESSKKCGYDFKTRKNENKRDFVYEYLKDQKGQQSNIQECAQNFLLIHRGINPENYFCARDIVSQERINSIYDTIKETSDLNFISFYMSYLRKIGYGYNQDFIDSALRDVKIAYSTLRKCNFPDWDCPEESITVNEMENLYNILTQNKNSKTQQNKTLEEK